MCEKGFHGGDAIFLSFEACLDSSVDDSVSDKHTASIFRAEMVMLISEGIYMKLEEGIMLLFIDEKAFGTAGRTKI